MITFIERLPHCPRCGGNLGREYDYDTGWDVVCLQCGHRRTFGVGPGSDRKPAARRDERAGSEPQAGRLISLPATRNRALATSQMRSTIWSGRIPAVEEAQWRQQALRTV